MTYSRVAIPKSTQELRKTAEYNLISAQKCTTLKDARHTYPSYGRDINVLADERRWLYEKLSQQSNTGSEKLRIDVNKQVLFLDPAELESEYQKVLDADCNRVTRERGKLYA